MLPEPNDLFNPTQRVLLNTVQVLARAQDWGKGMMEDNTGRRCLLGGIREASRRLNLDSHRATAVLAVEAAIHSLFPDRHVGGSVAWFNDDQNTTHDEVILVLWQAIKLAQDERKFIDQVLAKRMLRTLALAAQKMTIIGGVWGYPPLPQSHNDALLPQCEAVTA